MASLSQQRSLLKMVAVNAFSQTSCIFLARLECNLNALSKEDQWQAAHSFPVPDCLLPTSSFHRIVNRASHDKDDCSERLGQCCVNKICSEVVETGSATLYLRFYIVPEGLVGRSLRRLVEWNKTSKLVSTVLCF